MAGMEFSNHNRACVIMNLLFFYSTFVRKPTSFKAVALCILVLLHLLHGGAAPGSREDGGRSRNTSAVVLEMHQDISARSANNFCMWNNCSTLNFTGELHDHCEDSWHSFTHHLSQLKLMFHWSFHMGSVNTTGVSPIVNFLSCSDLTVAFLSIPKCRAGEEESWDSRIQGETAEFKVPVNSYRRPGRASAAWTKVCALQGEFQEDIWERMKALWTSTEWKNIAGKNFIFINQISKITQVKN